MRYSKNMTFSPYSENSKAKGVRVFAISYKRYNMADLSYFTDIQRISTKIL